MGILLKVGYQDATEDRPITYKESRDGWLKYTSNHSAYESTLKEDPSKILVFEVDYTLDVDLVTGAYSVKVGSVKYYSAFRKNPSSVTVKVSDYSVSGSIQNNPELVLSGFNPSWLRTDDELNRRLDQYKVEMPKIFDRGVLGSDSSYKIILLASSTEGATIYYSTDGSEPNIKYEPSVYKTSKGSTATGILVKKGSTLSVIAKKDGMPDSNIAEKVF